MSDIWTIILYVIIFLSLYVQVFFLFSFLKNRKNLFKETSDKDVDFFPSVSFLVPCWNESATLRRTMESIFSLEYPKDKLNIVIIDDGSSDDTWRIMQSYKDNTRIKLLKKENGGKHTALNLGLENANTELLASVDADTILDKKALLEIVKYFKNTEIAAVGGSILIENPSSFVGKAQSVEYQMNSYIKKMLGFTGGVLVAPGAFSVFRTDAVKKVGGYREGNNQEDLELTFRIQTNHMKVDHCHTAFAFTKGPSTIRSLFRQRVRWSRGFLGNVLEYKEAIFNKKFGNFGMFSLPIGIMNYLAVFYVFSFSWVYFFKNILLKIEEVNLVGFEASSAVSNFFKFDLFFFDTRALSFLVPLIHIFLIFSIFVGMRLAKSKVSPSSLFCFGVVYSFVPIFWNIKSVYYTVMAKMPSWR